jgi:hypothetical protein
MIQGAGTDDREARRGVILAMVSLLNYEISLPVRAGIWKFDDSKCRGESRRVGLAEIVE